MTRRRATISGSAGPAAAGRKSPARTAILVILLAASLGGCGELWSRFTSDRGAAADTAKDDAAPADDDTKCQSAGYQYGTPEYSQCRESLASKRAVVRDIPLGPVYGPQR
jgi:hypothetical protein